MKWGDLFSYDPILGGLTWANKPSKSINAGAPAGSITNRGYAVVSVNNRRFLVHRVIWEMFYGEIPEGLEVDHINHNRIDNRIENLRLVSRLDNLRNQSRYRNNTSGMTGVCYDKVYSKWRAHITIDGKTIALGKFASFDAAAEARKAAEVEFGFHSNHGAKACR
ncbi:MAG: HNH endonuclease signature motif containing protein [Enterobacterales bacterium]